MGDTTCKRCGAGLDETGLDVCLSCHGPPYARGDGWVCALCDGTGRSPHTDARCADRLAARLKEVEAKLVVARAFIEFVRDYALADPKGRPNLRANAEHTIAALDAATKGDEQ